MASSHSDISRGNSEVANILRAALTEAKKRGLTGEDADNFALRMVNLAGFYEGEHGWKRMAPDRRDVVQIRKAVRQPDNTFAIENLVAFCPIKVVRGKNEVVYTPERIAKAVENTNRYIAQGGQRPPLTIGHPDKGKESTKAAATSGFTCDTHGVVGLNVLELQPETKNLWSQGRYEGLSVSILPGLDEAEERIDHVALLGSSAQAVGQLPAAAVFSANQPHFSENSDLVCFSLSQTQGVSMNLHDVIAQKKEALMAALEASAKGETGADEKVAGIVEEMHKAGEKTAAHEGHADTYAAHADDLGNEREHADHAGKEADHKHHCRHCAAEHKKSSEFAATKPEKPLAGTATYEHGGDAGRKGGENPPAGPQTTDDGRLPAHPPKLPSVEEATREAFAASLKTVVEDAMKPFQERLDAIEGRGKAVDMNRRAEAFKTFMSEKIGLGHLFDQRQMFSLYEQVADNEGLVDNIKRLIESTPIAPPEGQKFSLDNAFSRPIGTVQPQFTKTKPGSNGMNWDEVRKNCATRGRSLPTQEAMKFAQALCVGNVEE